MRDKTAVLDTVEKIRRGTEEFFNSTIFIWFVAAITLVFWWTKQEFAGLVVIITLIALVLFVCRDASPVMTCFIFVFFVFSDMFISFDGRELWLLFILLPIAGFIYNIIRYRAQNFAIKGFSLAFLLALVPWLMQGVTRGGRNPKEVAICLAIGVAFVAVYFGISVCARRTDGRCEYIAKVLLALGVLISVQILIFYLGNKDYKFSNDYIMLGWGTRNPVAAILALTMPSSFYFATKKGKLNFLFIALGCAEFLLVLLLKSRGVTLVSTVGILAMFIYTPIKAANRKGAIILEAVFVAAAIGMTIFAFDKVERLFSRFITSGLDGLGRLDLFKEGLRVFKRFPIFGAGFDFKTDVYYYHVPDSLGPVYYHDTFIQILACFGIFGLLAYAYLYFWRYRIALTKMTAVKFALLVGMLVLEGYSLVDTVYFQPMAYCIMMFISLCMEKDLAKEEAVPICIRFIKYARGAA